MEQKPLMKPRKSTDDQDQDSRHSKDKGAEQSHSSSTASIRDVVRGKSDKKPKSASSQEGEASISSLPFQEAGDHLTQRHLPDASDSRRKQGPFILVTGLEGQSSSQSPLTDAPSKSASTQIDLSKIDLSKIDFQRLDFKREQCYPAHYGLPLQQHLTPDDLKQLGIPESEIGKLTQNDHGALIEKIRREHNNRIVDNERSSTRLGDIGLSPVSDSSKQPVDTPSKNVATQSTDAPSKSASTQIDLSKENSQQLEVFLKGIEQEAITRGEGYQPQLRRPGLSPASGSVDTSSKSGATQSAEALFRSSAKPTPASETARYSSLPGVFSQAQSSREQTSDDPGLKAAPPERATEGFLKHHHIENLSFDMLNFRQRATQKSKPLDAQSQNVWASKFKFSAQDLQRLGFPEEEHLTSDGHSYLQHKFIIANRDLSYVTLGKLDMKAEDLSNPAFRLSPDDLQRLGYQQGIDPSPQDHSLLRQRIAQINLDRKRLKKDFQNMYPGESVPPLRETLREASPEEDTTHPTSASLTSDHLRHTEPEKLRPDERRKRPSPKLQWLEDLEFADLNFQLRIIEDSYPLQAQPEDLTTPGYQFTKNDLEELGFPESSKVFPYDRSQLQKKFFLANLDLSHLENFETLEAEYSDASVKKYHFSPDDLQRLKIPPHYIGDLTPHDHSLLAERLDWEDMYREDTLYWDNIDAPEGSTHSSDALSISGHPQLAEQKKLFASILSDEKGQPTSSDTTVTDISPQQDRIERTKFTDLNFDARKIQKQESLDSQPSDYMQIGYSFSQRDLQLLAIPEEAKLSPHDHRQIQRKLLLANWDISEVDLATLSMKAKDRFNTKYVFSPHDLQLLAIPDAAKLSPHDHSLLRQRIVRENLSRISQRQGYRLKHPEEAIPSNLSTLERLAKVTFSDTTLDPFTHSYTRPSGSKRPSTPARRRSPVSPRSESVTLSSQKKDFPRPASTRKDNPSSVSSGLFHRLKRGDKLPPLVVHPSDAPSQPSDTRSKRKAPALMSSPFPPDLHGDALPNLSSVDLSQLDITQTDIYRNNINALSTRDLAHLGIPHERKLSSQERTQIMQRLDQENSLRHTLAKETGRDYKRMKPGDDLTAFLERNYKGKTTDEPGYHQAKSDFLHHIREERATSDAETAGMAAQMPHVWKSISVLRDTTQFDYSHIDYSQVPLGELTVTQADIRANNTSALSAHDLSLLGIPQETRVSSKMREVILQDLAAEHAKRQRIHVHLSQEQGAPLSPEQLAKYQLLQEGMRDDTDQASLLSTTTQPLHPKKRSLPQGLKSLTGWELNLLEAQTELDVAKHTHHPLKRYQADKQVGRIHEQKRSNRDRFFKKGLFPAFIHVLDTMQDIVIKDVKTPVEPTVSSKPGLQSDKGYEVIDRIREADKVNSQRYTRYAKANALSLFKRESEQAISKQAAFAHLEKAVLRESGRPEYSSRQTAQALSPTDSSDSLNSLERSGIARSHDVKDRLKEIRRKLHDAEQAHLQAHGTVDIESGEIKINDHNPVRIQYSATEVHDGTITIALHDIKTIAYDKKKKGWFITTYSSLVASTKETSTPLASTKEAAKHLAPTKETSTLLSAGMMPQSPLSLHVPHPGLLAPEMARGRSYQSNISSRPPTRATSLARSVRDTDTSFTPDDDLHSHYSFPAAEPGGSAHVPTCEVSEKGVFVPKTLLQSYSHTNHLINFKTGRIELANGTTLTLNEIDWTKTHTDGHPAPPLPDETATKAKPPTTLHLKQNSVFYKDGAHFDLSEAVKPLDADGIRHRTSYSEALRAYRQAQVELLEEAAHYGSQAYIPAVMAGIRTNENTFTKVIRDLTALERPGGIVSLAHYEDAVHATMTDASVGLLHGGQKVLNFTFTKFTLVLKRQARQDLAQQQGLSQFGSKTPSTLQALEGTSGALSPTELQNSSHIHTYDQLMAIERHERTPEERSDLAIVEQQLRDSPSPFTRNSYLLRKIAEYEAQGKWAEVKQHVDTLENVSAEPGDSNLVKSRKQYENNRVDHIKNAFKRCQETTDANELRMALYEERYHDAVMQYNTNQVKKALGDSVTLEGTDHPIPRLKRIRQMNLDNIITDPDHLSHHEQAVARKLNNAFSKATFRVKPEEFTAEGKTPEEAARLFVAHVRDLARYEIQALIDRTQETTAKEKIIDGRDGYEKDFTEKFIKQYDNEKTREHEFARLKEGRKAMKAFAIRQILISMIFNYQMGMNSFDQGVDTTLNSLIRNATRV